MIKINDRLGLDADFVYLDVIEKEIELMINDAQTRITRTIRDSTINDERWGTYHMDQRIDKIEAMIEVELVDTLVKLKRKLRKNSYVNSKKD